MPLTDLFDPLPGLDYLEPFFHTREWTPEAERSCRCRHQPIPEGSPLCCMACHRSGRDGSKRLKITRDDVVLREGKTFNDQWGSSKPTALEPNEDGLRGGQ